MGGVHTGKRHAHIGKIDARAGSLLKFVLN